MKCNDRRQLAEMRIFSNSEYTCPIKHRDFLSKNVASCMIENIKRWKFVGSHRGFCLTTALAAQNHNN